MLLSNIRKEFVQSTIRVNAGNINRKGSIPYGSCGYGPHYGSLNAPIIHTKDAKIVLRKKNS
jgi:hypothetical protein